MGEGRDRTGWDGKGGRGRKGKIGLRSRKDNKGKKRKGTGDRVRGKWLGDFKGKG